MSVRSSRDVGPRLAAMDFQILEEACEDKKPRSSYEDDGEIGRAVPRLT